MFKLKKIILVFIFQILLSAAVFAQENVNTEAEFELQMSSAVTNMVVQSSIQFTNNISSSTGKEITVDLGSGVVLDGTATYRGFILDNASISMDGGAGSSIEGFYQAFDLTASTAVFTGENTFSNNTSTFTGAAISAKAGSFIDFSGADITVFSLNEVTGINDGAAVSLDSSTAVFGGETVFSDNKGSSAAGAGIGATNNSYIDFTNAVKTTFSNNEAWNGAGISLKDSSRADFGGEVVFSSNTSGEVGGGAYVENSYIDFTKADSVLFEYNEGYKGGALYLDAGSTADFGASSVTFSNNQAVASGAGDGGAVYAGNNSSLNFEGNVLFESNSGTGNGGALYVSGSSASFSGENVFVNNKASNGGAIAAETNSTLYFAQASSSVFKGNEASENGGAVYLNGSNAFFSGYSEFENNYSSAAGGAVYMKGASVLVFNDSGSALFSGNTAKDSGGAAYAAENSTIALNGTVSFENNSSGGSGGAIALNGANIIFDGDTFFSGNNAVTDGGALSMSGNSSAVFNGNTSFAGNIADSGGAVYLQNSVMNFSAGSQTSFTGNSAISGGGAYISQSSMTSAGEILFENNYSSGTGGALSAGGGSFVNFEQGSTTTFKGNIAVSSGGAVYLEGSSMTAAGYLLFEDNSAVSGGAVYALDSYLDFSDTGSVTFRGNQSAGNGSAMYLDNSTASFSGSVLFENNYSSGTGVLYLKNSNLTFGENSSLTFEGNTSSNAVGAVYLEESSMTVSGEAVFNNNVSKGNGGALYAQSDSFINFVGTTVYSSNTAILGGALYNNGSVMGFSGSVLFSSNAAMLSGGAVFSHNGINTFGGNVSFEDNLADSGSGGAIYAEDSILDFVSGTTKFERNTAYINGGAIYLDASTMTSTGNLVFDSNLAVGSGGAIYADNSIVFDLFSTASFTRNSAYHGGAIALNGSSMDVYDGIIFSSNSATLNGGALYLNNSAVKFAEMSNANFEYNKAGYGGAVYLKDSNASFDGKTYFSSNSATFSGGAVYMWGSDIIFGTNTVVFNRNTAADGGAVYAGQDSYIEFADETSFLENSATGSGGALYVESSSVTVSGDISFERNSALNDGGAAVLYNSSKLEFSGDNVIFSSNSAGRDGGAVFAYGGSEVNFKNGVSVFENNSAGIDGGAVKTDGSYVRFIDTNVSFSGNSAENGGAIAAVNGSLLEFDASTTSFSGNISASSGGAVYIEDSTMTVNWLTLFENNYSSGTGGALFAGNGDLKFENISIFDGNNAAGLGGAAYVENGSVLEFGEVSVSTFAGNSAKSGGALAFDGSEGLFSGEVNFTGNSASDKGGAIYAANNSELNFGANGNVSFIGNSAAEGGALYIEQGTSTFGTGVSFTGNTVSDSGAAIYMSNGKVLFNGTNAVFENNSASTVSSPQSSFDPNAELFGATTTVTKSFYGSGGAIFTENSEIEFAAGSDAAFKGNMSVSSGGAVYITDGKMIFGGSALFENNVSSGMTVTVKDFERLIGESTVTLQNITLEDKQGTGGAIFAENTSFEFTQQSASTFSANTAVMSGGAIYLDSGSMTFKGDAEFSDNASGNLGGAIYARNTKIDFSDTSKTVFSGNTAEVLGGALYLNSSDVNFEGEIEFDGNSSLFFGGAVYAERSDLDFSNAVNASFTGNSGYTGGAFYLQDSSITFRNDFTATGNTATDGSGGFIAASYSYLDLKDLGSADFSGNNAKHGGGSFYLRDSVLDLSGTGEINFTENAADNGGALNIGSNSRTVLDGKTVFSSNTANAEYAGAVSVFSNSVIDFTNTSETVFEFNKAVGTASAGALYVNASTAAFGGKTEFNSNSSNVSGGALYAANRAFINMAVSGSSMSFTNNSAAENGGALYMSNYGNAVFGGDVVFENNAAGRNGGAVYAEANSVIDFSDKAEFKGNKAFGIDGGAVYLSQSKITFGGEASFEDNIGGAVYALNSVINFSDSDKTEFKNNTSSNAVSVVYLDKSTAAFAGEALFENNLSETGGAAAFKAGSVVAFGDEAIFIGNEAAYKGGAIYSEAKLDFAAGKDIIFSDNKADTGGALALSGGKAAFKGSTLFEANASTSTGGAVNMENGAELNFSAAGAVVFKENSGNGGGALFMDAASALFESETLFENNYSSSTGGAVNIINNSAVNFTDTSSITFTGNTAEDSGGAAFVDASSVLFNSGITFTGNASNSGSGGALYMNGASVSVSSDKAVFKGNSAADSGGAVYAADNSLLKLTAETVSFENNSSSLSGGALYITEESSTSFGSSISFENNEAAQSGGAIWANLNSVLNFVNSNITMFEGNLSNQSGGAVYVDDSSAAFGGTVKFENNKSAGGKGGAVFADGSSVDFTKTTLVEFTGNEAVGGGALYLDGNSEAAFGKNVIFENNISSAAGGAIAADNISILDFTETLSASFSGNIASSSGGAVYFNRSNAAVFGKDTLFKDNRSGVSGGAVFAADNSVVSFSDSRGVTFSSNSAAVSGGALFLSDNSAAGFGGNVLFENNVSSVSGGAVYAEQARLDFSNANSVVFAGNSADSASGKGGAVYLQQSTAAFGGAVSFSGNGKVAGSNDKGGAVYGQNSLLDFTKASKTVFESNNALYGSALYLDNSKALFANEVEFSENGSAVGEVFAENNSVVDFSGVSKLTFKKNLGGAGSSIILDESTVKFGGEVLFGENRAESSGSAISAENNSFVDFSNVNKAVFEKNEGIGLIALHQSSAVFGGVIEFKDNANMTGGAIYAINSSVDFSNAAKVSFINTTQPFYMAGSNVKFGGDVNFSSNNVYGGAINANDSLVDFTYADKTVFAYNTADPVFSNGPAALSLTKSTAKFAGNNLFENNVSSGLGGAIYMEGSSVAGASLVFDAVKGAITAKGNKANGAANDIYMGDYSSLTLNAQNYDIRLEGGIQSSTSSVAGTISLNKNGVNTLYLGGKNYIAGDINLNEGKTVLLGDVSGLGKALVTDGILGGTNLKLGSQASLDSNGKGEMAFDNADLSGEWFVGLTSSGSDKIIADNIVVDGLKIGISGNRATGVNTYTIIEYGVLNSSFAVKTDNTLRSSIELFDTGSSVDMTVTNVGHSEIAGITKNGKQVGTAIDTVYSDNYNNQTTFWNNIIVPMDAMSELDALQAAHEQLSGSFIANVLTVPSLNAGKAVLFNQIKAGKDKNIWGDIFVESINYEKDDNVLGDFKGTNFGIYAGADLFKKDDMTVGVLAGYSGSSLEQANDSADITDLGFGGYIGWFKDAIEVKGSLKFGYQSYDTERKLETFGQTAKGSFNGYSFVADVEAGYKMKLSGIVNYKPFIALGMGINTNESYKEDGSDGALDVESGSYVRSQAEIGVAFEATVNKFDLYGDFGLGYLLSGATGEIKAKLAGHSMTIEGTEQGEISGRIGIGGEYKINEEFGIFANAGYKIADGVNNIYGNAGVSYKIGK